MFAFFLVLFELFVKILDQSEKSLYNVKNMGLKYVTVLPNGKIELFQRWKFAGNVFFHSQQQQ